MGVTDFATLFYDLVGLFQTIGWKISSGLIVAYMTIRVILDFRARKNRQKEHKTMDDFEGTLLIECPVTHAHSREAHDALKILGGNRKRFVSLKQYRALIEKNPNVVTGILDENGNMVAYFDIFPLTNSFGPKFIAGECTEKQLYPKNIHNAENAHQSDFIYVGAVFNLVELDYAKQFAVSLQLRREIWNHVGKNYPPRPGRKYIALSSSKEGENILRKFKFQDVTSKEDRSDKSDVYVLEYKNVEAAVEVLNKRVASGE